MLDYLELDCAEPAALMVWLHGLGADGYDLQPVAEMLGTRNVRHVFPHAPVRPVTINGGMAMRAWYDITSTGLQRGEDSEGMLASARQVADLVQTLRGDTAMPVLLAGFSQGAVISLTAAVQGLPGLAGIAALSGYVPRFTQPSLDRLRDLRLFLAHGEQDEVIPFALGKAAHDALVEHGLAVDWRSYAMSHAICREEIQDIATWLARLLEKT
jgi:phospholipase/carboxylesterase